MANIISILLQTKDETSGVFGKVASNITGSVGTMARSVQTGMNQAAVALGALGVGLTAFEKQSIDYTSQLVASARALSRQSGDTIEDSSKLIYVFQRMGMGADQASVPLRMLAKQIAENSDELKDMHINTQNADGSTRSLSSVLFDVADKFKDMPNGVDKTNAALKLFGRQGTDMIKVLNLGSDGIRQLEDQAAKLGLTITDKTAGAIATYIQSQKDLTDSANGLKVQVGTLTAPVLTRFNETILMVAQRVLDANTPLGKMAVYFAAFGGPVATAAGGLLGFMANVFTISSGLGLFATAILGVTGLIAGGGGLLYAFGNLLGLNFAPLESSSKRLFDQLITSTNDSITHINDLAKTPGWEKPKSAADSTIGQVARYMDRTSDALKSGGFKGAIDMIGNDLRGLDINGILGSWIDKFASFPWEQHTENITNGIVRMLGAMAANTDALVAKSTPSLIKIAEGLISGFIQGIFNYAVQNPLDFALLLISLGFMPAKVVGALGGVLAKIPIAGPIGDWILVSLKAVGDFVTAPIKGFFAGVGDVMVKGIKIGWDGGVAWLKGIVEGGLGGIRNSVLGMFDFVKGFNWGAAISGSAKGIGNALIALLEGGINGALKSLPGSPKISIPRFARGTDFTPGGTFLAGEEGPELIRAPRGSTVYTASETRRMLSDGGSGGGNASLSIANLHVHNELDVQRFLADIGWRLALP
ncbi:phage tail tape measure protein [Williamsia sterculiae]|uniref:Tape measure domain-containing protein n=1 Tax=Williamsia sterculiae TaxID=1344003 RepID=A0A1N7GFD9_9NOCA|nr:phage tail tape measure protein [Williamsia sterculiae]SIS11303.1 hypothetical protein SAMN05445060_2723 [Williamsia sterculiae]